MATNTTNFSLVKPAYADTADIADINGNMDIIDTVMKNNKDATLGIASIITGDTNNSGHAISAGEYFIANGTKYKATATIPSGGTWSNSKTSVSDHDLINALSGNIANLGTITTGTTTGSVTVPDNESTLIASITLTKGKWIIIACCDWQSGDTGYRQIGFQDTTNPGRNLAVTTTPAIAGSKETFQQLVRFLNTNGETVNLYARQTNGSSRYAYPYIYAMKVGD